MGLCINTTNWRCAQLDHLREKLDCPLQGGRLLLDEWVERVPKTTLADQLQCRAAHPIHKIDLFRSVLKLGIDRISQLQIYCKPKCNARSRGAHLPSDLIKDRQHMTHVVDWEYRHEHLPLLAVTVACVQTLSGFSTLWKQRWANLWWLRGRDRTPCDYSCVNVNQCHVLDISSYVYVLNKCGGLIVDVLVFNDKMMQC